MDEEGVVSRPSSTTNTTVKEIMAPRSALRVDCIQERIILLVCIQVKRGQGKLGIGLMWLLCNRYRVRLSFCAAVCVWI